MTKNKNTPKVIKMKLEQSQAARQLAVKNLSKHFKRLKPIYSIKDEAAGFMDVFQQKNDAIAVRAFSEAVNDPKSPFNRYPKSFTLFKIGNLDEETGEITAECYKIMNGLNALEKKNEELPSNDK